MTSKVKGRRGPVRANAPLIAEGGAPAAAQAERPQIGGSFVRDRATGQLRRVGGYQLAEPEAQAPAIEVSAEPVVPVDPDNSDDTGAQPGEEEA